MNKQKNQQHNQSRSSNKSKEAQYTPRIVINEDQGMQLIKKSSFITTYELARQANVKLSTANRFLQKMCSKQLLKKIGGHSGHYVYTSEG